MKQKRQEKVISFSNLPTRFPTWQTVAAFTALKAWEANAFIYLVVGMFMAILWGIAAYAKSTEKETDIFNNE